MHSHVINHCYLLNKQLLCIKYLTVYHAHSLGRTLEEIVNFHRFFSLVNNVQEIWIHEFSNIHKPIDSFCQCKMQL